MTNNKVHAELPFTPLRPPPPPLLLLQGYSYRQINGLGGLGFGTLHHPARAVHVCRGTHQPMYLTIRITLYSVSLYRCERREARLRSKMEQKCHCTAAHETSSRNSSSRPIKSGKVNMFSVTDDEGSGIAPNHVIVVPFVNRRRCSLSYRRMLARASHV